MNKVSYFSFCKDILITNTLFSKKAEIRKNNTNKMIVTFKKDSLFHDLSSLRIPNFNKYSKLRSPDRLGGEENNDL